MPGTGGDSKNGNRQAPGDDRKMLRDAGMLSLLTLVSRVLGLFREMTKARFLGTGGLSDAFTVSFMIPNFMRRLFAEGSVSVAFIPTFKGYLHEGDERDTEKFLSSSFTVLVFLVCAVVALGIAFTPWIVKAFGSDRAETAVLTRMMFPFLALVSVAAFFQGILNSFGVFAPSGFAPILFNVCYIILPWAISRWTANPARSMAIGVIAGGTAQAVCQLPAVIRTGSRFGFAPLGQAFRNPGMRRVFALIAPTILGMAAYQLNDLVSTAFASRAGVGIASAVQYSLRLQELILGVFAVSAGTVLLPMLSDSVRRGDWKDYSGKLGETLRTILLVSVPVAVFSMISAREIVTLLFRWGDFSADSVILTSTVFVWHQTGLPFIASNRVIAPAFYARSDTKTPTWAGIASFAVNMVLVVILGPRLKGPGIALALSFSSLVNTAILTGMLGKSAVEGMKAEMKSCLFYSFKLVVFSLAAAAPVLLLREPLNAAFAGAGSRLLSAGVPFLAMTLLFSAVGIGLLVLTKDPVAASIARAIRRRSSKKDSRPA